MGRQQSIVVNPPALFTPNLLSIVVNPPALFYIEPALVVCGLKALAVCGLEAPVVSPHIDSTQVLPASFVYSQSHPAYFYLLSARPVSLRAL